MGGSWPPRGPDDLDDAQRDRIRRRVLSGVRTGAPGASDHLYTALTFLAAPAPHLVRIVVSLGLVFSVVASTTVASADALPDEPLYGVKLASEQVRFALAQRPVDRAAVQLSMAEHRLAEAERLALAGRDPDALVASSVYATHLANAAAELASIERSRPEARAVVERLKARLAQQQRRAAEVAVRLASDPASALVAPVFETVASAPPSPSAGSVSERIAEHAAKVNDRLRDVAEDLAARSGDGAPADDAAPEPPPASEARAETPQAGPRADRPAGPAKDRQPGTSDGPKPGATAGPQRDPKQGARDGAAEREALEKKRDEEERAKRRAEWERAKHQAEQEAQKAHDALKRAKEEAAKKDPSPKEPSRSAAPGKDRR